MFSFFVASTANLKFSISVPQHFIVSESRETFFIEHVLCKSLLSAVGVVFKSFKWKSLTFDLVLCPEQKPVRHGSSGGFVLALFLYLSIK